MYRRLTCLTLNFIQTVGAFDLSICSVQNDLHAQFTRRQSTLSKAGFKFALVNFSFVRLLSAFVTTLTQRIRVIARRHPPPLLYGDAHLTL